MTSFVLSTPKVYVLSVRLGSIMINLGPNVSVFKIGVTNLTMLIIYARNALTDIH